MLNQPLSAGGFEKSGADTLVEINPGTGNPFPGLRPYSTDESHLFFGREGQVDEILVNLSKNRFVTVMGFSGSGKSSLMYCGLIPVLYGGFVAQTGPNWQVITTRPGTKPIQNLAESVVSYLIDVGRLGVDDFDVHVAIISSVLRSSTDGLVEVTRFIQNETDNNVFFLVDQFEEIFRYRDDEEDSERAHNEALHYVNLIMSAVGQTKLNVYAALTMRSDFIGNCSLFPGLTALINQSNYLVPQLTREQKRMVIEGPVSVAGGRITPRLVKRLLNDAGGDQDQLPILQHALMRTWEYWKENREAGESLDLRHYNSIGKISQALSLHANEAYDELSTREKEIAEVLFKSVTEKSVENRGTRRACKLGLIAELSEASETEVIAVVDHFRRSGRSFLMPSSNLALTEDSMIELSHESLMRIWNRLDNWVEEEFESALMYKRLSDAAAMYQIGKTGLWRPPDLQLALNWQRKQKPTRAWAQRYDEAFERALVFLDTSRITYEAELKNQEMMQRRVLRRTRATAVVLGIAAVIAILFMVFAYIKKIEADRQTDIATAKEQEARILEAQAKKERAIADSLRILAEESSIQLEISNQELAKALIQTELEKKKAEENLREAKRQESIALRANENEREARGLAEAKRREAQENFDKANRLLMLTKAQAMAAKSRQENDDKDLAGLLAMQAYHFHRRYSGNPHDPYVYSGLYYSLTKLDNKAYNAIKVAGPPRNRINSLAVSSRGNSFYTAGVDGRIFNGDYIKLTNQPIEYTNAYPNKVIDLSKDERYLVNGTDSAFVQIFDLRNDLNKPLVAKGFNGATNDLEFLPNGSAFIVASGDFTSREYKLTQVNPATGELKPLVLLPTEGKSISISPDGNQLAVGTWGGKVYMVNLRDNSLKTIVQESAARILSVQFSPDGKSLAYGIDDLKNKRGSVKLLFLATGETRQFSGHLAGVFDVEFSPDGKLLASAGADKKMQMWVLDHPEDLPIEMDNNNGFIFDISFTPDSNYLIAATSESEIRVWPTDFSLLADKICPQLSRNMSQDEWSKYVGNDIDYESTCLRVLIKDY